jgi:hypothetical protein
MAFFGLQPLSTGIGMNMALKFCHRQKWNALNAEEEIEMGRMREHPRYNVISMRISDEERDTLLQIMQTTQKSVSDIMREAMELFKSKLDKPQVENQAAWRMTVWGKRMGPEKPAPLFLSKTGISQETGVKC